MMNLSLPNIFQKYFLAGILALLNLSWINAQIAPGDKDVNFGTLGIVYNAAGFTTNYKGSCIDSKGRIITVGYTATGSDRDMIIVRYTPSGVIDNTFDSDGFKTISYSGATDERAYSVTSSGNKIYIAGLRINGALVTLEVICLLEDGSLDNTFDGDGISSISIPGQNYSYACNIVVDAQNKIIIGGQSSATNGSDTDFCIVRLTSNGTLDNTFDTDGVFTLSLGTYEYPTTMVLNNSSQIILAGYMYTDASTQFDFYVIKVNGVGELDTNFDTDGKVSYSLGSDEDEVYGMALDASNKLVLVGKFRSAPNNPQIGMIRISEITGAIDNTFGVAGYNVLDVLNGGSIVGRDVVIDLNGKIIVAASSNDFHLIRLNSNGTYDNSFGTNAVSTVDFVPANTSNDQARCLLQDKAGRLLVSGYINFSSQDYLALSRIYNYAPDLDVSATFTNFSTTPGSASADQTYVLEGIYIPDSLAVTPPAGYELSLDGSSYSSSTFYLASAENGIISPVTIHVRLQSGLTEGPYSGSISHSSNEVSVNQAVDGSVAVSTAIQTAQNTKSISLYPSPAVHELIIETTEHIKRIEIRNLSDKVVCEVKNSTTIPVDRLPAGVYIVEIQTEHTTFYSRILVE